MTLREKIFLGFTAAAAIGAGLYYASGAANPAAASSAPARADFSTLITNVEVGLRKGELTVREERVLATAATEWLRSPLRDGPLVTEQKRAPETQLLPKYIGFIDIGAQPIAIIDGRDYRAGDAIQGGEFRLSQIHPDHIKLLRRGATEPVNVPLEKDETTGGS